MEELEAVEALGRNWEFLNWEATTEGEYTPTVPDMSLLTCR